MLPLRGDIMFMDELEALEAEQEEYERTSHRHELTHEYDEDETPYAQPFF